MLKAKQAGRVLSTQKPKSRYRRALFRRKSKSGHPIVFLYAISL